MSSASASLPVPEGPSINTGRPERAMNPILPSRSRMRVLLPKKNDIGTDSQGNLPAKALPVNKMGFREPNCPNEPFFCTLCESFSHILLAPPGTDFVTEGERGPIEKTALAMQMLIGSKRWRPPHPNPYKTQEGSLQVATWAAFFGRRRLYWSFSLSFCMARCWSVLPKTGGRIPAPLRGRLFPPLPCTKPGHGPV